MADNVAITAGSGTAIAADEVTDGTLGSVKVQYVKLMDGTLDGTTKGVIGANGLKVDVQNAVGVAQGSTTSGQTLSPVGGAVVTSAPAYTNGQTNAPSLTVRGGVWTNFDTIQGTAADVNSGNKSAGTLRVVIATDQPALTNNASKWKAGASAGWASAFGGEVNSVVSGNSILSSVAITNSSGLDQYIDISFSIGSITSGSGTPYLGFYLYPLNQDGTTYGDGRFSSSATGQPFSNYFLGAASLIPSVTQAQTGAVTGAILPPGDCKLVLYQLAGANLAGSANVFKYRSYNTAQQ